MPTSSRGRTAAAALLLGGLGWAGLAVAPASAHVTVEPSTTAAGGSAVLTFAFSHGCEGSPTTGLTIRVPEQVESARPTLQAGWDVEKVMTDLTEPVTDSHGNQLTERVDRIELRAGTPVPDGYRQTFEIQVTLPEDAAGTTLAFPVVQTCEDGETAWIQVPADGQDADSLDTPAPTLEVTAGGADPHAAGSGTSADPAAQTDAGTADTTAAATSAQGPGTALGVAGLVAGLAGLAAGVTALVRGSRSRA